MSDHGAVDGRWVSCWSGVSVISSMIRWLGVMVKNVCAVNGEKGFTLVKCCYHFVDDKVVSGGSTYEYEKKSD